MRARIHETTYNALCDACSRYHLTMQQVLHRASLASWKAGGTLSHAVPPRQLCGRDDSRVIHAPHAWIGNAHTPDQLIRWYLSRYDKGTTATPPPPDHVSLPDGSIALVTRSESGRLRDALELIAKATTSGDPDALAYIRGVCGEALA